MTTPRQCKDCVADGIVTERDARFPGPRCYTHHKAKRRRDAIRNHQRHVARTYGLDDGDYTRLLEAQGGRCAICQRATGKARRLAVDHNHDTGEVRGLLCGPCNRELLGRYPPDALQRAIDYLTDPPARPILTTRLQKDQTNDPRQLDQQ